jgi:hypothetical protein
MFGAVEGDVVNAGSAAPDEASQVLATAVEVLRQHFPDADGWCMGCLGLWGRLVFHEQCTQADWARGVRVAYLAQARYGNGHPGSHP